MYCKLKQRVHAWFILLFHVLFLWCIGREETCPETADGHVSPGCQRDGISSFNEDRAQRSSGKELHVCYYINIIAGVHNKRKDALRFI